MIRSYKCPISIVPVSLKHSYVQYQSLSHIKPSVRVQDNFIYKKFGMRNGMVYSLWAYQLRFGRTRPNSEEKFSKFDKSKASQETGQDTHGKEPNSQDTPKSGLWQEITGIKEDVKNFPDIYNVPNMLNLAIFSVFALSSTGTQIEADWWISLCGIGNAFAPWTWATHFLMTGSFPAAAFAMMLLHSMCQPVAATMGAGTFNQYCLLVILLSGATMWIYHVLLHPTSEAQYGPWDLCAALFVAMYLQHGTMPLTILGGFHGWLRYASFVGAITTLYFNTQPTVIGSIVGLLLCKTKFKSTMKVEAKV